MYIKRPKSIKGAPRYLTVTEVADALGVSADWACDHAAELGGFKVASQWRFAVDRMPGQPGYVAPGTKAPEP